MDGVCIIPVKGCEGAIVDEQDRPLVESYRWHVAKRPNRRIVYACAYTSGGTISMHRLIMGAPSGQEIDHRDRNGLNNRRENLRIATHAQNQWNQEKTERPVTSRYKGVCRTPHAWRADISFGGRNIYLGSFRSEEPAARAYNAKALELFGEFARLNEIPLAQTG
jgi:hypothetical protein